MWRSNRGTGGAPIKSMDGPRPFPSPPPPPSFAAKKLQKTFLPPRGGETKKRSIRIDCLSMNRKTVSALSATARSGCLIR